MLCNCWLTLGDLAHGSSSLYLPQQVFASDLEFTFLNQASHENFKFSLLHNKEYLCHHLRQMLVLLFVCLFLPFLLCLTACGILVPWSGIEPGSSALRPLDHQGISRCLSVYQVSLVAQCWRIHLQCKRYRRVKFDPWVGKIPWRRAWLPTSAFLPGEFHEQRSRGGLQFIGLQRVRHDWSDWAHPFIICIWVVDVKNSYSDIKPWTSFIKRD